MLVVPLNYPPLSLTPLIALFCEVKKRLEGRGLALVMVSMVLILSDLVPPLLCPPVLSKVNSLLLSFFSFAVSFYLNLEQTFDLLVYVIVKIRERNIE